MAKWIYVSLVLLIATSGVALLLKFGYEPAPTSIMSPSMFDTPEQIGSVLIKRFYAPIRQYGVLVFGVPPQPSWHGGIVRGLVTAAATEKIPFDIVLTEKEMPDFDGASLGVSIEKIQTNSDTQAEFIDRIRALRAGGKRVLVYTASVFSSHLLSGNAINRYEYRTGEKLFAITSAPLALRSDQEHVVDPPCVGSERDKSGTAALGCAVLKAGRMYYRKKVQQDRFVAIMNSSQPEDFLLMVSPPGQKGN